MKFTKSAPKPDIADAVVSAFIVVLIAIAVTLLATAYSYSVPTTVRSLSSVVKITNETGMGSGVIISDEGLIVTNAHVVGDSEIVEVTLKGGALGKGHVLWTSPAYDVALVKIEDLNLTPAPLRCELPAVGERVYAIGHPLGQLWTTTFGYISAIRGADLQIDVVVLPGNSGGGLFDEDGNLLGLPRAMRLFSVGFGPAPSGQNIAVSSSTLCLLLDRK